jgi:light-regulated signal transduction histidine kinase (bacteriophytochrome)
MGELIDDLLELSRVGRAALNRRPVDLSSLARSIAADLARKEPDRRVEFVIEETPIAGADLRLLQIVLENLLGNAWKFTSKVAAPRIEFHTHDALGETQYIVRDNGDGFDAQYAAKLFQPFQRLHLEADFAGTGIGLATVHRIIDRHGGRVWAESVAGNGAAFLFTIGSDPTGVQN